jgi:Collagen triple helix repeat (20 copies)
MFSGIRKRLTYANIVMTLALVFAISGGAYAAGKYLINSTKQINPKVLKALKGKSGANGVNGTNGANGKDGAQGPGGQNGVAGANGANGENGVSVASKTLAKGDANCKEGGSEFIAVESKKSYACNGSSPTGGGTLPKGSSEKGRWAAVSTTGLATEGVSFDIPLASAPAVHYINASQKELTATGEQTSTVCTGSVVNPTAPEGTLCVYANLEKSVSTSAATNESIFNGWKWGVVIDTEGGEGGVGVTANTALPFGFDVTAIGQSFEHVGVNGSWAVTG